MTDSAGAPAFLAALRRLSGAAIAAEDETAVWATLESVLAEVPGIERLWRATPAAGAASGDYDPGLVLRVADTGEAVVVGEGPGLAYIPLDMGEEHREVAVLRLTDPRAFAERDIDLVLTLTEQAAAGVAVHRARAAARVDSLTGSLNHGGMHIRIEQEIARVRRFPAPLSCVMLDLDNFKSINDGLGHLVGDDVLRDVAEALRHESRQYDSVARYGGDEFVVILPATASDAAVAAAERMRNAILELPASAPYLTEPLSVSAGVAEWHEPETSVDLLRRADEAMLEAKHAGRNAVCLAPPPAQTG